MSTHRPVRISPISGCLLEGRVVPDGESVPLQGSCQTLKCLGNKFQKSNEGLHCGYIVTKIYYSALCIHVGHIQQYRTYLISLRTKYYY